MTRAFRRAKRVRDVAVEANICRQEARLFSEARLVLAQRHLGEATMSFDALEAVLTTLLVAANAANQRAEALLATRVGPVGGKL